MSGVQRGDAVPLLGVRGALQLGLRSRMRGLQRPASLCRAVRDTDSPVAFVGRGLAPTIRKPFSYYESRRLLISEKRMTVTVSPSVTSRL
jgi:hypothetical protein